jgi:Uma2 family endonuclease
MTQTDLVSPLVSIDEYLNTDYSPDCDYVDGVLEDRNVGRKKHATTQTEVAYFLRRLGQGLVVLVEQRVQISGTRFRVPDVCVLLRADPEEIVTTAPFLCVEVLSPDDRMSRMQEKIADYRSLGVRYIWVIDPYSRTAWTYTSEHAIEAKDGVLRTEDPNIEMPLSEVLP